MKGTNPSLAAGPSTSLRLFVDAVAGRGAVAAFSILSIILITRSVGVGTYGVYATATGFSQIIAAWTDLGSAQVVIRESIAERDRGIAVRTYFWTRFGLIAVSMAIGAGVIPLAFASGNQGAAFVALSSVAFCGPSLYFPVAQMHGAMRTVRNAFALQGIFTFASTALIIVAVPNPTAAALAIAPALGALVGTLSAWAGMHHHVVRPTRRVHFSEITRMMRMVAIVGAGTVLSSIYSRIDAVILLRIAGPEAAGIYAGAYRILDQTRLISNGLMTPISPAIAAATASKDRKRLVHLFRRLRPIVSQSAAGLTLILAATAPITVWILLGPGFNDAVNVLVLLSGAATCYQISQTYTLRLLHEHLERPWILGALACVVINIGMNYILVPTLDETGAAISTVATELALVVFTWIGHLRAGPPAPALGSRRAVAGAAVGAALALAASTLASHIVAWPILALTCATGAWLLFKGAVGLRGSLDDAR